jgi:hypothetical protein
MISAECRARVTSAHAMRTSHAHIPCAHPMRISHAHIPCAHPMRTSHAHIPCAHPMRISHAHLPCAYLMRVSHAHRAAWCASCAVSDVDLPEGSCNPHSPLAGGADRGRWMVSVPRGTQTMRQLRSRAEGNHLWHRRLADRSRTNESSDGTPLNSGSHELRAGVRAPEAPAVFHAGHRSTRAAQATEYQPDGLRASGIGGSPRATVLLSRYPAEYTPPGRSLRLENSRSVPRGTSATDCRRGYRIGAQPAERSG